MTEANKAIARIAKSTVSAFFILVWFIIVGAGFWNLIEYEYAPGPGANPSLIWPRESNIQPVQNIPNLIMLLHPKCPCSRASLAEFSGILDSFQGKAAGHIVFVLPRGTDVEWAQTDVFRRAKSMPGVKIYFDKNGKEAALFNASTSGQTLLYDAGGKRVFRGGITASRGHYGESAGRKFIENFLNRKAAGNSETLVFGCPLTGNEASETERMKA